MGADGHITIWRDDKVREVFPDCDELFGRLPNHYRDQLDGITYHHCYHGDGMYCHWNDSEDWYFCEEERTPERVERLTAFVRWLNENGTEWEVWT